MIAIDEAVQMCEMEDDTTHQASWLSVQILAVYDQVNCIRFPIEQTDRYSETSHEQTTYGCWRPLPTTPATFLVAP